MGLKVFKKADGSKVAVNPAHVRTAEPNRNKSTKLNLPISPGAHWVDVQGDFDTVVATLNGEAD